ncbi:MAG: hypothetical protein FVQ77_04930 [Cytophagales bacterium]|nr:hypothetical protein [Cytophagales bacterium]
MSIKEKITKEIDMLPEPALEQLYHYLQYFRKDKIQRHIKKNSEEEEWVQFAMQEFLKGYAKSDAIYDKL